MPAEFVGPSIDWYALSPLLVLLAGGLGLLVVGALTPKWPSWLYGLVTATTAGAAGVLALLHWFELGDRDPGTLVADALAYDSLAQLATMILCGAAVMVALFCVDDVDGTDRQGPEVFALILMAVIGGVVMASANDLIVLFLGLEILSLALYVLVASDRRRSDSQEGGMKYFVLGGFASAFFLYGVALLYGATGSTNISRIIENFQGSVQTGRDDSLVLAAIALLLVGMAFKIAAVPFHVWVPDVYQGAPTPITAFMASLGKTAAFVGLIRILIVALPFHRDDWRPVIWAMAVASLIIAPTIAIVQTNVKRMLAYGSVSHAGFVLVAFEAAGHRAGEVDPGNGMRSIVMYMMIYSALTIGTMAIIGTIARVRSNDTRLTVLAGLAKRHPLLAVMLTILLIAQAGVPLTAGFVAKFGAIQSAVEEQSYVIAIVAMSAAVIAAFVYLRIMVTVWMAEAPGADRVMTADVGVTEGRDGHVGEGAGGTALATSTDLEADLAVDREPEPIPLATKFVIAVTVTFTLVVGVFPNWLLEAASRITNTAP